MSEHLRGLETNSADMAPIIAIGGLLSVKRQAALYAPILRSPHSALSIKERFLPIPDHGLSSFDEMSGKLDDDFVAAIEKLEGPAALVGHSLGAYFATELAIKYPDKVLDVTCLAGVHDGIKEMTITGKFLRTILGNPKHADDLFHDSERMTAHRKSMAKKWPAHIPLHLISPTHDVLIPSPQGLETKLPKGQQPQRQIVVPLIPGLSFGIKEKTQHLEVEELRAVFPAEHVDLALCPPVIGSIRQARRVAAAAMGAMTDTKDVYRIADVPHNPIPAAAAA